MDEDGASPKTDEPQRTYPDLPKPDLDLGRQPEPGTLSEVPIWSADEPSTDSHPQPAIAVFSDKDESAVAGLLALGTSTTEMMGPDLSLSEFTTSPAVRERSLAQVMTPINFADYSLSFSSGQHLQPSPLDPEKSPTESLELLRHYRYEIAPWVRSYTLKSRHIEADRYSWIYVTSDSCWASRACSWRWYRPQSELPCWRSRRHLQICYAHIHHTHQQTRAWLVLKSRTGIWMLRQSHSCASWRRQNTASRIYPRHGLHKGKAKAKMILSSDLAHIQLAEISIRQYIGYT